MHLNINSAAVVKYTNKLEQMHRKHLPLAVRGALNKAAFDVKTNTMPDSAKKSFIQRKQTFFKANSKVTMAQGFKIEKMQSVVGFMPKSEAVKELEQQEHGGAIGGKAFIPLKHARTGKSWNKMVRANMRMAALGDNLVDSKDAKGMSKKEQFIKSVIHAGKGGFVIGDRMKKGGRIVHYINSIKRKGRDTIANTTPVYSVLKSRKVNPKATHFMNKATRKSASLIEQAYINEAIRQLKK